MGGPTPSDRSHLLSGKRPDNLVGRPKSKDGKAVFVIARQRACEIGDGKAAHGSATEISCRAIAGRVATEDWMRSAVSRTSWRSSSERDVDARAQGLQSE